MKNAATVAKLPEESPAVARLRRKREAAAALKLGDVVTIDQWNVKRGVAKGTVVAENNSEVYPEKLVEGSGNSATPIRVWYHYSVLTKHDSTSTQEDSHDGNGTDAASRASCAKRAPAPCLAAGGEAVAEVSSVGQGGSANLL